MFEFFVVGGIAFYALIGIASLALFFLVEAERELLSVAVFVGTLVALQFMGDLGLIGWVIANPLLLGAGVLGYILAGGVWSFVKWYFFLLDKREVFMEARREFIASFLLKFDGKTEDDARAAWIDLRKNGSNAAEENRNFRSGFHISRLVDIKVPLARTHKRKIVNWMAYWPWSLAGSFVTDFLRRVFNSIYNMLAEVFQKISDHVFRDVADEV